MNHVLRGIVLLEIAQVALARKVTILTGPVRNAKGQNVVGQNAVGQNGPVGIDQKVAGQKAGDQKDVDQRDEAPKAGVRKGRTGLRVRLSLSKAKWPGFRKTFMAMLMA